MTEPWEDACSRIHASMVMAGKDQEWVVARQPDMLTVTMELRAAKAEIHRPDPTELVEIQTLKKMNAHLSEEIEQFKKQIGEIIGKACKTEEELWNANQRIEQLKAQVPKERLKASVEYNNLRGHCVHIKVPTELQSVRISRWLEGPCAAKQWGEDRGLEVVNDE